MRERRNNMKQYDQKLLDKLIDRYENSLLYTGQNQLNLTISVPVNKSLFPEYFEEGSLAYDTIHEQLEALENQGLISLQWKKKKAGHILEKCILNTEKADEIYRILHRKSKKEKNDEVLEVCRHYQGKAAESDAFIQWIRKRIANGESIQKILEGEDAARVERLCRLVWHIVENKEEIFLRQFSIQVFHDSKIAEKDIRTAVEIIRNFHSQAPSLQDFPSLESQKQYDGMTWEEILEEYNIYRNPSWVMLKGYGIFTLKSNRIDISQMSGGLGLSNQDLIHLEWCKEAHPETILTIENLTSFHQWKPDKPENLSQTLCIYLGGYHNQSKRTLLKKLYQSYPHAQYYHFGDIDCGGFQIWKDLCIKTDIPFQPWHMDLSTYTAHLHYGKELTQSDHKTLEQMKQDSFFQKQVPLFEHMQKENLKIEQECIDM